MYIVVFKRWQASDSDKKYLMSEHNFDKHLGRPNFETKLLFSKAHPHYLLL